MSAFIERQDSFVLVIDVQERLHAAMDEACRHACAGGCALMVQAARGLNLPIVVTEQYPEGLGRTIPELAARLEGVPRVSKLSFSCMREGPVADVIRSHGRNTAVLVGIEAHVCVLQTALDMMDAGMKVAVASDAVCSRRASDKEAALEAMRGLGVLVYPVETVIFMLLGRAGTPEFRALSPLLK
jgi:nicotinamidase-related amidase